MVQEAALRLKRTKILRMYCFCNRNRSHGYGFWVDTCSLGSWILRVVKTVQFLDAQQTVVLLQHCGCRDQAFGFGTCMAVKHDKVRS